MRRLSTVRADVMLAAADLELLAERAAQRGDHAEAARLRSEAGALYQIAGRL